MSDYQNGICTTAKTRTKTVDFDGESILSAEGGFGGVNRMLVDGGNVGFMADIRNKRAGLISPAPLL
jgi:hypothetical protein